MRIGDLFGAIRRQWVLSLLLAVLVAVAAALVVRSTPPTYGYTATVLLLPPDIERDELEGEENYTRANPLFYLGSLTQARDILISSMSSKDVREEIEEEFPHTSYAAVPDALSSGPVLVIEVESTDEAEGSKALDALTESVPVRLRQLQKGVGVKKEAMIQSHPLTRDTEAEVSQTARVRQGILAAGGLSLVALFCLGLLDALRSQRRSRRKKETETASSTSSPVDAAAVAGRSGEPAQAPADAARATPVRGIDDVPPVDTPVRGRRVADPPGGAPEAEARSGDTPLPRESGDEEDGRSTDVPVPSPGGR